MALDAPDPAALRACDDALAALDAAKDTWARMPVSRRITLLKQVRRGLLDVAEDWAETSAREKALAPTSPLVGEEWISGPYATLFGVNAMIETLSKMKGKAFLNGLKTRRLATGQLGVRVLPRNLMDRLLLSGISAEVWMQPGVTAENLSDNAALTYDTPEAERTGKVALVLGAGNIASITPLDVFQKLILENQVVLLKMNPVNDYLTPFFERALKPLIDVDALRILTGDGAVGAYLSEHPLVSELHITGSDATHDAIVWGTGEEGERNRAAGTPKNTRRFTSELGSVSPTIVVPGPWSEADLAFQAENIATMKLHNSGHNCIACQALILPEGWVGSHTLREELRRIMRQSERPTWYPGTSDRLSEFLRHSSKVFFLPRMDEAPDVACSDLASNAFARRNEVFGPALGYQEIPADDPESFLRGAIAFANDKLWGTLGANILIHPDTIREIGQARFEEIISDLRYGTIGVNGWCAIGFLIAACPWGAYPGHTAEDIQSGTGTVHNAFMLENTERTVVRAPFRPFPRSILSGELSVLPRPPWFITNRRQDRIGRALTRLQGRTRLRDVASVLWNAMQG